MSTIDIIACDTPPEREELNGLLAQYYGVLMTRMAGMGLEMDRAAPESAMAEFWENIHDYLPPTGCLVLARDENGKLVGCGMLKSLDDETGELKRLYVDGSCRGTGTGRRLIEARIDAARRMGLKRLVVDTLTISVEMRSLYPKLGFIESGEPIDTTTHVDQPSLRPHLHYFTCDISA